MLVCVLLLNVSPFQSFGFSTCEVYKWIFFSASPVQKKPSMKMAMDAAKPRYPNILKMQKSILTLQDRPDDSHYNINVTLSDQISMDRKIRDTRPQVCQNRTYDRSKLPRALASSYPSIMKLLACSFEQCTVF